MPCLGKTELVASWALHFSDEGRIITKKWPTLSSPPGNPRSSGTGISKGSKEDCLLLHGRDPAILLLDFFSLSTLHLADNRYSISTWTLDFTNSKINDFLTF